MSHEPIITPTELDWARLAAFIDGEGCILLNLHHKNYSHRSLMFLRVIVSNTDPRLVKWCRDRFGGRIHVKYYPKSPTHRPAYSWQAECTVASKILQGCLEYFVIKREEAEIALEYQNTVRGPGSRLTEEQIQKREKLRTELQNRKRYASDLDPDQIVRDLQIVSKHVQ